MGGNKGKGCVIGCGTIVLVLMAIGIISMHWKKALVSAIIAAVALVIYGIVKNRKNKRAINNSVELVGSSGNKKWSSIDSMDGHSFEYFCADILRKNGYSNVNVTQGSGDQGVDIIAERDGIKYAVQCKRYTQSVGNKAVQEIYAGKQFYHCHVGAIMTNNYFTSSAKELAKVNGIILWDRDYLMQYIGQAQAEAVSSIQKKEIENYVNHQNIYPEYKDDLDQQQKHYNDEILNLSPESPVTLEKLQNEYKETLKHFGNIFVDFFKEHYYVNTYLLNARSIGEKTEEFIIKCETLEQAKYLTQQESVLNDNLQESYKITLLSNNCISIIVSRD